MAHCDTTANGKSHPRRMTVPRFSALKSSANIPTGKGHSPKGDSQDEKPPGGNAGQKITMITAYDHSMAKLVDGADVEGILVGDSMSMVVQGHENTLPVTLDEIIYHAEMVGRAVQHSLVVVDMPFPSYHLGCHKAIENAARVLKETRCQAVKLEGGAEQAETIAALVSAGIPVMAHCGLRPQNIHVLGGYRVQRDQEALMNDAQAAADAGAFAMVLECIPTEIARTITNTIAIPTIGIGAGPDCDGQVLVLHDVLGLQTDYVPRFVKAYANLQDTITQAVRQFRDEVRDGQFPGPEHGYK
jgi:3-methyl-2-oxobutanoate hydroxymethyltransferase